MSPSASRNGSPSRRARELRAVPRGLASSARVTAKSRLERTASDGLDVASELRQRRGANDHEDRDAQQRGAVDHQGLSLAKTFERARRRSGAAKAGRLRRDHVTAHSVHGASGESMRASTTDHVDVHHDVQYR